MMEADPAKACNPDDATWFIQLNALRLKVAAKVRGKSNLRQINCLARCEPENRED